MLLLFLLLEVRKPSPEKLANWSHVTQRQWRWDLKPDPELCLFSKLDLFETELQREMEREREKEKDRPSIRWFNLQMATVAGPGPG